MIKKLFVATILVFVTVFVLTSECGNEKKFLSKAKKLPETPKVEEISPFHDTPAKIAQYLNDETDYSVYLEYPKKSSDSFIHNSHKIRSASMIKVFIMAAVMEKVKSGEISLDEPLILEEYNMVDGAGILVGEAPGTSFKLRDVLELMITYSDNTATNMIIDRIGGDEINAYAERHGYNDTFLGRKMMFHEAIAGNGENYSSARDLGLFFKRLYNYQCVNEKFDKMMIDILLKQTDTDCFPAALPDKKIAHKTGALDDVYDDGGIIYSNAGDAILVIMTENSASEYETIQHMKNFARAVIK
ncbi:MAG: serine hydrolase [Selenomonadaceae bacterium]|nr:serine hydrolase [Selenomonadaceae bacterium]